MKYKIGDILVGVTNTVLIQITSVEIDRYAYIYLDSDFSSLIGLTGVAPIPIVESECDHAFDDKVKMKYKVGDVVCSSYNELLQITDVRDGYYLYTMIYSDAIYNLWLGATVADTFKNFEYLYTETAFKEETIEPLISLDVIVKLCKCPTFELVNFGCKCGGV